MGCGCQNKSRRMVGRQAVRASAQPDAGAQAVAAVTGSWATSCDPDTPIRSLLRAQAAARECGGRVQSAS